MTTTYSPETTTKHPALRAVTLSQFLQTVSGVENGGTQLLIAVRDPQHFNHLIAHYAVTRVSTDRGLGLGAEIILLDVEHVT